MDLLKDATKNLSLYEVKAYVRKAQNVAMNLTEMEAKVREATNNEPWGASTTLMSQIASGTYNYREREEILSFIFRRFTEKAANEWRQIYKSLQLLEYLIKNGSERLIDDARANLSLIQMLKSFHYIDSKGRDQGINVRNRAKNLINLLNDDSLIRTERKKARSNAKKFGGVSSSAYGGNSPVPGASGYGMDDEFNNRVYGDGGVYGERYDDPAAAYANGGSNDNFEEYDVEASAGTSKPTTGSSKVHAKGSLKAYEKSQPQPPQADLLLDLVTFEQSPTQTQKDDADDDDFDDFQAAPSQPQKQNLTTNLSNLYQTPTTSQPMSNIASQQQPQQTPSFFASGNSSVNASSASNFTSASTGPAKSSNNDAFSSLFSSAKSKSKPPTTATATATSMTTAPTQTPTQSHAKPAQSTDDDLFGDFGSNTSKTNGNSTASGNKKGDEIDLLSF